MRPAEIGLAADWAAAEGWNPGLADAPCFASVDAGGFLIGELDGEPAAVISTVNYDDRFAFLGFYMVRADLRGHGYGMRMWEATLAHAAPPALHTRASPATIVSNGPSDSGTAPPGAPTSRGTPPSCASLPASAHPRSRSLSCRATTPSRPTPPLPALSKVPSPPPIP